MSEPVISDEEVEPFLHCGCKSCRENVKKDLAAFLKGRVPDALDREVEKFKADGFTPREVALVCFAHNACRDIVLRGGK